MAQANFIIGERVLCYEPEPGKVNKLYPAVVKQVIIFMCKNNAGSENDHRLISSRRFFWCTFVGGANAGTGEILWCMVLVKKGFAQLMYKSTHLKLEVEYILYCSLQFQ